MTEATSAAESGGGVRRSQTNASNGLQAKSYLTKIAAFILSEILLSLLPALE